MEKYSKIKHSDDAFNSKILLFQETIFSKIRKQTSKPICSSCQEKFWREETIFGTIVEKFFRRYFNQSITDFNSMKTFALQLEIYLAYKFQNCSLSCSWEPRKGKGLRRSDKKTSGHFRPGREFEARDSGRAGRAFLARASDGPGREKRCPFGALAATTVAPAQALPLPMTIFWLPY